MQRPERKRAHARCPDGVCRRDHEPVPEQPMRAFDRQRKHVCDLQQLAQMTLALINALICHPFAALVANLETDFSSLRTVTHKVKLGLIYTAKPNAATESRPNFASVVYPSRIRQLKLCCRAESSRTSH
jgi:hypothetical protein